jgi:hypothetical protein
MPKKAAGSQRLRGAQKSRPVLVFSGIILFASLIAIGLWLLSNQAPASAEAPEAETILKLQASMPFQILIPAYLPRAFDRAAAEVLVNQVGPGGEPMVQITYRTQNGETLFVREWVPVNPDSEILATSRPIETKWGKAWLLVEGESLAAIWVDVGPLRVSVYTGDLHIISPNTLLQITETLGPPSNQQIFYFVISTPAIKDAPPPKPYEVPLNAEGVQEFTLVVTPGGYDPLRVAVKAGVPVRMHFRMLGQVGCGNTLLFPSDPQNPVALQLKSEQDEQVLDFTPTQTGQFAFYCSHQMYRGLLIVNP